MWLNPQETADLVVFSEEILYRKLYFLSSVLKKNSQLMFTLLIDKWIFILSGMSLNTVRDSFLSRI